VDEAWRPPAPPPAAGERLDGYADLVEVGRGGDSVVYRARETTLGRDVAIKVLDVDDPSRRVRFEREVQLTVELGREHPHIVTVLATGETASGRPCLVMDYFARGSLHDRLRSHGPLPVEEVATIGAVLADALAFAHERGVLHRDVKPQNVLVLPTSWVLADFGIARLVGAEHTASAETFTYRHAAPQVLDGQRPTAADDIWSLGSTLFTLLDGRPPFAADDPDDDSALAYLRRARTEDPRLLTDPAHAEVAEVLARCLVKDPDARWSSARDLQTALTGIGGGAWRPSVSPAAPAPAAPAPTEPPSSTAPRAVVPHEAVAPESVVRPDRGGVPAGAAPPPAAESEVARSAIDAIGGRERSQDLTGTPEDVTAPPLGDGSADPGTPGPPVDPPRRRWGVPLALGLVAGLVAVALLVAGSLLRGDGDEQASTDESLAGASDEPSVPDGVPTRAVSPTPTGDPQVQRFDEELSFVFTDLRLDGTTLRLQWEDPTDGTGAFFLSRSVPKPVELVTPFEAGTTEGEVTGVELAGRTCFFLVVAADGDGRLGRSDVRCVTP
jgi:serine/threonine protein kinase